MKRDQEVLQSQFLSPPFLELKSFGFSTTIFSVWFLAGTKKNFPSSEALLEKLHIPTVLCQLAKHSEIWHQGCSWVFISLRYRGRHSMRLSTETEGAKSFKKKATTLRKAFQRRRVQYFQGIPMVAGSSPICFTRRKVWVSNCFVRNNFISFLTQFQLRFFNVGEFPV